MKQLLFTMIVFSGISTASLGADGGSGTLLPIDLAELPAGNFIMGNDDAPLWDQKPAHKVDIAQSFRVSITEITLAQYRQFRPEWNCATEEGLACGMTWYDAVAFCDWLSGTSGKAYRLPTEAEWEYLCRLGTASGVRNMANDVREWCYDWYGPYAAGDARDPVGAAAGLARVVRGGVLDQEDGKYALLPKDEYKQPAYRAGTAPAFGVQPGGPQGVDNPGPDTPGYHHIGFRVVLGPMPRTVPVPPAPPFVTQGVGMSAKEAQIGPDKTKPYFRKRRMLPSPPETGTAPAFQKRIEAAGLDPAFRGHNHSPALEICDNGDVLLVIFTSYTEYEPEMSLIASRLRFGADTWDMPSCLIDSPGTCDNTPLLWKDQGRLHLFWAWTRAVGAYPFQWITSDDHGATWSEAHFPHFTGPIGPHSLQPINRAFRASDGTVYVPSDAIGGTSVLWASRDNLESWFDTGGRSAGRHTGYCELKDGRILAMGGKNTDIDGFMPKAVSSDGAKTWEVSKSVFPALAVNQRPSLLRLQSGRLFFASDFQKREGIRPAGASESGSFAALSDDQGETWHLRKLPGTQEHENGPSFFGNLPGASTLGYSVARQAPNGVIHLITTMNRPCLHFEMNEAWILEAPLGALVEQDLLANTARSIHDVRDYREDYPDGSPKRTWSAGTGDDGRYLLQGTETWYYPGGKKQFEAHYVLGCKTGLETLWRTDGSRQWEWEHGPDGESHWTQWWEDGTRKAESVWKDFQAMGIARTWNRRGELCSEMDMTKE